MFRKLALAAALSAVALVSACALLPERFSVNAPWLQEMLALADAPDAATLQARIQLPPGYEISLYAADLGNPRLLLWSGDNLLFSDPYSDSVRVLRRGPDGRALPAETIFDGLDLPHGLALHAGRLYIAGEGALYAAEWDAEAARPLSPAVAVASLPAQGGGHWTRTVKAGPDGLLYVAAGSSCNACLEDDPRRAALLTFDAATGALEIYADGLRNTVGFDWRGDGALYGVDNGRDWLGDDNPPDELNRIEKGGFYGWPFLNGFNVPDPDYGERTDPRIAAARPPAHGFQAHVAPLSLLFVGEDAPLPGLQGAALVGLHGSWNRSSKVGYKLVSLHWDAAGNIEERDFATGFEANEEVIGRPVDIALGPDGALYVSDDHAGAIYRIAAVP